MKLLISVTVTVEIEPALQGGADIIDVKNPAEGALGAAPAAVLSGLADLLWPDRLASAALGESDSSAGVLTLAGYGAAALGVRYIKLGLRLDDPDQAITLLRTVQAAVHLANPQCGLIAVGYADAARIEALSWQLLPEIARQAQVEGCMIDTALKDGRRLFDYCDEPALERWLAECRQLGLLAALAGSLTLADLPALARLQPDVVGFRGAACAGDRVNGRVTAELVAALRAELVV
jgi:uncharacterized protein (UPF0264 family)